MRKVILMLIVFLTASVCQAAIDWEYWSPLTVTETITDIGGGDYQYEYSFENVDTSPIWTFAVFGTFSATSDQTFSGYNWIDPFSIPIEATATFYDGRNLDPDITQITISGVDAWVDGDPTDSIQISELASGVSYTATSFDSSPKYYFYCTIDSGRVTHNGTGKVAAVGTTVPEPMTILLFGLGICLLRKKNKPQSN